MKICVRNNKTYEFIRWISAGEKLKDNEEIDSIELEKRNKNIDKKTFNAVEDLINITIMHLLHMGSSEEDNTKILMQLKEIDECISDFNEEQMRKLRYILLANDCKWCKFDLTNIKHKKSIKKFFNDEKAIRDKAEEEEYEGE